jgi:hypothetical protein
MFGFCFLIRRVYAFRSESGIHSFDIMFRSFRVKNGGVCSCERDLPNTVAATSNVSRLTCPTFSPLLVHQHCAFTPCCAWGVRLRLRRAAALCLYSGSGVARPSWGGLTDWFAARSLVFAICVVWRCSSPVYFTLLLRFLS